MGKKKRNGRKKPAWKKWGQAILTGVGAGVGGLVALIPTYRGITQLAGGDFEGGARAVLFDTTGIGSDNRPNVGTIVGTMVTAGAGVGIALGVRWLAQRLFR